MRTCSPFMVLSRKHIAAAAPQVTKPLVKWSGIGNPQCTPCFLGPPMDKPIFNPTQSMCKQSGGCGRCLCCARAKRSLCIRARQLAAVRPNSHGAASLAPRVLVAGKQNTAVCGSTQIWVPLKGGAVGCGTCASAKLNCPAGACGDAGCQSCELAGSGGGAVCKPLQRLVVDRQPVVTANTICVPPAPLQACLASTWRMPVTSVP